MLCYFIKRFHNHFWLVVEGVCYPVGEFRWPYLHHAKSTIRVELTQPYHWKLYAVFNL